MEIRLLHQKEEMLEHLDIVQQMYPDFTLEKYGTLLDEMLKSNYSQIIIIKENQTIALTGVWVGTKLWSGKYVEIDSFVVHENFRGQKIGDLLIQKVHEIAKEVNANQIVLDAFTTNFAAGKFYINHGFVPKGFHFIKFLNQ
ncbi:GNAT family N-acetyltransferase [Flavobacterium urocaniciphilum]|uniref:Acetyltransferase (GNAT) family protein n=1 Tax=Flavobacterium urocaniciphilum TaxID=1299341 RepID=A0A1H9AA11_9FLAO|nr:GNAT family N-acetyltransferase [Flavobacterium urocaniciphilum]SEP73381.1 Acetyltransferase (GNAT) family protein [Flavobacterium urocaniciphilum]